MLANWSFLKIAKPEAILYQIIYIYLEKKKSPNAKKKSPSNYAKQYC